MKKNSDLHDSAVTLAVDAQALLAATADVAEEKVIEARKRLSAALDRGKKAWGQVQDQAVAQAKAADEIIRSHPYQSLGIAFSLGALIGLLMRRRA